MTRQFTTLPTIDGYDVIDSATGRPMDHRDTLRSANGVAFVLNDAAQRGPASLATLLGCGSGRRSERRAERVARERP